MNKSQKHSMDLVGQTYIDVVIDIKKRQKRKIFAQMFANVSFFSYLCSSGDTSVQITAPGVNGMYFVRINGVATSGALKFFVSSWL